MNLARLRQFANRHLFLLAISGAVVVGFIMTLISMSLYFSSGASQLDLSRPGYEDVRAEVRDNQPANDFSPTGPLNPEIMDEFQELFDEQREALNSLSDYDDRAFTDKSLRIE